MYLKTATSVAALSLAAMTAHADEDRWSGSYAGLYVASTYSGTTTATGIVGGHNFLLPGSAGVVVGLEIDGFVDSTGDTETFVLARGGYIIHDRLLGYASFGRGVYNGTTQLHSEGFGLEFAATDNVNLRVDYTWHNVLGAPFFSGPTFLKAMALWNF